MAYSRSIKLHPVRHQQLVEIAVRRGYENITDLLDMWIGREAKELRLGFPGIKAAHGVVTLEVSAKRKINFKPDEARDFAGIIQRVLRQGGVWDPWGPTDCINLKSETQVIFQRFARGFRIWIDRSEGFGMTAGLSADLARALISAAKRL